MTILSIARDVCKVVGLDPMDALFTSTSREHVEMAGLANEMVERIAYSYPWQEFSTIHTISGDGSTESFPMPSDYNFMTDESQVWSSSLAGPLTRIDDMNVWLSHEIQEFGLVVNSWIMYGGQLHIKPALASGVTAKFVYQKNGYVIPVTGPNKKAFTADTDTPVLSERTLKLGIIWQWKAHKGLTYAEDMANFNEAVSKDIKNNKGAKSLMVGRRLTLRGTTQAYPVSIIP